MMALQNQRKGIWWILALASMVLSLLVWRIWPTPQPYYNGKALSYWFEQLPEVGKLVFPEHGNVDDTSISAFIDSQEKFWIVRSWPSNMWLSTDAYIAFFSYRGMVNTDQKKPWIIDSSVGTNICMFSSKDSLEPETMAVAAIRSMGTNALPFLLSNLLRQRSDTWERVGKVATKCGMGRFFFSVFPDPTAGRRKVATALLPLVPLPQEAVSQLQNVTNNAQANGDVKNCASWVLKMNAEFLSTQKRADRQSSVKLEPVP
jgi:hypothetical protein